ncbi:MAG: helix-turn-helix domain-containing protein [Verrucomicrobiales bacterium]|nr:helix-turn-helix domain-containing protein [Verrucomicrobiales bacterium]
MKKARINELERSAEAVARGEKPPSRAWKLRKNAAGGWERIAIDPEDARRDNARNWKANNDVAKIRANLNLTQSAFADLMGIPIKTLQKWEGNETRPSGPAQTLLKIAAQRPDVLLELQDA